MTTSVMEAGELETVGWVGDAASGFVRLIDQTRLPVEFIRIDCRDIPSIFEAIRSLRVRGAPAIGIAAAYGAVLGGQAARGGGRCGSSHPPRGDRHTSNQPADRRQSVLGTRPH